MTDPRTILGQARQTPVPVNWRVFTKKRGKLSGFLRGSSQDPDPLLVWIDLHYRDGTKTKWRSTSFADNLQTIQCFIEAYGAHKALRER